MLITIDKVKELKPCEGRLENAVKFYSGKSFTTRQFMGLKSIPHDDKLWVALRLVDKDKLRLIAADIAESVLHIYESTYPNDSRPRLAIEAARSGDMSADAADAAADAARAADRAARAADRAARDADASARAAVYAAADADADAAAVYAAFAARDADASARAARAAFAAAAYAAADAAAAFAARDAAFAARDAARAAVYAADAAVYAAAYAVYAGVDRQRQEKLIRTIILRYWK